MFKSTFNYLFFVVFDILQFILYYRQQTESIGQSGFDYLYGLALLWRLIYIFNRSFLDSMIQFDIFFLFLENIAILLYIGGIFYLEFFRLLTTVGADHALHHCECDRHVHPIHFRRKLILVGQLLS